MEDRHQGSSMVRSQITESSDLAQDILCLLLSLLSLIYWPYGCSPPRNLSHWSAHLERV